MLTIFDPQVEEANTPKYINCKFGFLRFETNANGELEFISYTPNLRVATAIYDSHAVTMRIAKELIRRIPNSPDYFVVITPAKVGFSKDKEICI